MDRKFKEEITPPKALIMRIWYMDKDTSDPRLPHQADPSKFVTAEELKACTGVTYERCKEIGKDPKADEINALKKKHDYSYHDQIEVSPTTLPGYEEKIKMFFEEHLHTDDEVRLVVDGSGFFDVRDQHDRWIRIEVVGEDFITLPAGIYHRFTTDSKNYIKAVRLFKGEPVWTPYNRPVDDMPIRKEYLKKYPMKSA